MKPTTHSMLKSLCCLLLIVPSVCISRRSLANMLMDKNLVTQPQSGHCRQVLKLPVMQYETLSVDTRHLRFSSRLRISMQWTDSDLAWNESHFDIDRVVLPVNAIWIPLLQVENAESSSQEDSSNDVLVYSNGTVVHSVIIKTVVFCEVNLFKYPFASDACPIALNAWARDRCGMSLEFGTLNVTDGSRGDWYTESAVLTTKDNRDDYNYIWVSITRRWFSPFVTLFLPSILVIVSDLVSFALPLGGGERISFKVTLVLSFVMFLIILNDMLPGGSQCSPLMRSHFCACLLFLVTSMLASMLLTRLAKDGHLLPRRLSQRSTSKGSSFDDVDGKEELEDEESNSDISAVKVNNGPVEEHAVLQKVVDLLEKKARRDQEADRRQRYANKADKVCFWIYLMLCITYTAILIYAFVGYSCEINHFEFWQD